MKDLTLVILAAGMGSRYGGLKQIDGIGVNGATLMEYSIFDALKAGFTKVAFIIRKDIEQDFRNAIIPRLPADLSYEFIFQEKDKLPGSFTLHEDRIKPLGTAHALWCCKDVIKSPFAILNADDFYGRSGFEKVANFFEANPPSLAFCMVGYRLEKTMSDSGSVARGVCQSDDNEQLNEVIEYTSIQHRDGKIVAEAVNQALELSGKELVSMNFWGFSPSIFPVLNEELLAFLETESQNLKSEFLIPTFVNHLLKEKKASVKVLSSEDDWIGVTYLADKEEVSKKIRKLVEKGLYPSKLF